MARVYADSGAAFTNGFAAGQKMVQDIVDARTKAAAAQAAQGVSVNEGVSGDTQAALGLPAGSSQAAQLDAQDQGLGLSGVQSTVDALNSNPAPAPAPSAQQVAQLAAQNQGLGQDAASATTAALNSAAPAKPQASTAGLKSTYTVGGKTFDTQDAANSYLPQAKTLAQADAYDAAGNTDKAATLRSQAQQQALNGIQLDNAQLRNKSLNRDAQAQQSSDAVDAATADFLAKRQQKDASGNPVPLTAGDYAAAADFRAQKFALNGDYAGANKAAQEHLQLVNSQIQADTAARQVAVRDTSQKFSAGDTSALGDFYDRFLPDGGTTKSVTSNKDGSYTLTRTGDNGEALPPIKFSSKDEVLANIAAAADPNALAHFAALDHQNKIDAFNQSIKMQELANQTRSTNASVASSGRAGMVASQSRQDAIAKANAAVALYKQTNPSATSAQLDAVRTGVIAAVPLSGKGMSFHTGSTDPLTGKPNPMVVDAGNGNVMQVQPESLPVYNPGAPATPGRPAGVPANAQYSSSTKAWYAPNPNGKGFLKY